MQTDVGVSLRSVRADWLRVESEVAYLRMLFSAHAYKQALDRQQKFNPYHDEAGRFTTADGAVAGGAGQDGRVRVAQAGGGRGGRVRISPNAPVATQLLFFQPLAAQRVEQVRVLDPTWKPPQSISSGPLEPRAQLDQHVATVLAAEARLAELGRPVVSPLAGSAELGTLGIGGNGGPTLNPRVPSGGTGTSEPPATVFSAPYRNLTGMPSLAGPAASAKPDGTVALAEFDGQQVFGSNSKSSGYTSEDRLAAEAMRDQMLKKYPAQLNTNNIGGMPNDALYHSEATALLRAARHSGGTLEGRTIEVRVDRSRCRSCDRLLPLVGLELGNPTVTFIGPTGGRKTMQNGRWSD